MIGTMIDWEQNYLANDTPWDKGRPAPALVDWLKRNRMEGSVMVPGCGLGHDVRAIAARDPLTRVVGLDIAPSAVQRAHGIRKVSSEDFVHANLFDLPSELRQAFDWIWEHTCFCAIDPTMRASYVEGVHSALRPGGQFLAVFYLNPYDEEHPPETEHPPYGTALQELESLFSERFEIRESWAPEVAYPGREGREHMMLMLRKG